MDPHTWQRAKDILADLSECPVTERRTRLEAACGNDTGLRAELERLLALDDEAAAFFGHLQEAMGRVDTAPARIGVYCIEKEIGRGGMATVYQGRRDDGQFEQEVAIKVMRLGVGADMHARFRAERRILAQLQHPGIAYLMDGGSLADGRPYFIMERVRGEPVTDYADRKQLGLKARLDLFLAICAAVNHAHRNLVIHRDIKPGNVLVQEDDQGRPAVKLLDFGIARVVEEGWHEASLPEASPSADDTTLPGLAGFMGTRATTTKYGQRILTPRYAAPEQLRGEAVTAATDVHALGILLSVLLGGGHPFLPPGATPEDMERRILAGEPILPGALAAVRTDAVADLRGTTPRKLVRALRGNLDAIVAKALARVPEDRYGTAGALAMDLHRHMQGRTVEARPGTMAYRTRTFVRRHRLGAVMSLLALLTTATFATLHVQRITHERDLARTEAAKATQVSNLLVDMLKSADPGQARGKEVSVREILDQASGRIQKELANQPDVRARMNAIIGSIYTQLGKYDKAETFLTQALELQHARHGPKHQETLGTRQSMAALAMRRGKNGNAEAMLREVLAQRLKQAHPDPILIASTQNDLGWALERQGKHDEAEASHRAALAIVSAMPTADPEILMAARNNLAVLLVRKGEFEEAEDHYRQILSRQRTLLGPAHPDLAATLNNFGVLLSKRLRLPEAEQLLRESLAMKRKLYGDKHPGVALTMTQLANVLTKRKHYDAAESLYLDALAIRRAVLEPEHPYIATNLNSLAGLYREKRDYARAEPLYLEAIAICRGSMGAEHRWTADMIRNLGDMYLRADKPDAAVESLREALRIRRKNLPENHWQVADAQSMLGIALTHQGKLDQAEPLLRDSYRTLLATRGEEEPRTRLAKARLTEWEQARRPMTAMESLPES